MDLSKMTMDELETLRRSISSEIRVRNGLKPIVRPKALLEGLKEKRYLSYGSMTTYPESSIRRIAREWWKIDSTGITKRQLIDMVLYAQEAEQAKGKKKR